jgi:hypothetical protein
MNRFAPQVAHVAPVILFALMELSLSAGRSIAMPVQTAFVLNNVDWTSAGVGGIGGGNRQGGTAAITLTGVSGSVKQALLYWHGIDNFTIRTSGAQPADGSSTGGRNKNAVANQMHAESCDGFYNVPTILFNGSSVTGVPLGDSETNCWGDGSSRAFRADVTALVPGNGVYTLSNMTTDECDDVNGASLIVMFNDSNPANDRDLVFAEGNDGSLQFFFPGETDGWHATVPDLIYTSGPVALQLHIADGQAFDASGLDDSTLTISTGGSSVEIPDALDRYDGTSTPNAGFSRSEAAGVPGSLWDIHTFDISSAFTVPGTYTLSLDGQERFGGDCLGLVLAILDLPAAATTVDALDTPTWRRLQFAAPSPSPARGPVTLTFALPLQAPTNMTIYDATGRRIRQIAAGTQAAGEHVMTWDRRDDAGRGVRTGIYFARLEVAGHVLVRKIAMLR